MMRRFIPLLLVLCIGVSGLQSDAYGGGLESLQGISDGLAELAARVKPAVVAIKTEVVQEVGGPAGNPFAGTPFEDFFSQHPFLKAPEGKQRIPGLGSGVIVSRDGYILTNNHVIAVRRQNRIADRITVELVDKRTFMAEVVGRDPLSDVAVLKIDGGDLPTVPYGDSDALRVGEMVMAVGNPFGQLHTVTTGIVSALGRGNLDLADYENFIQTDAAVNPGNSGGALVNTRGELVGINAAIASRSGGYEGISFAIPINMARNVMEQLVEHGEVRRGLLGIFIQDITPEMVDAMNLKERKGVLISKVNGGGPADEAGLKRGDIVLEVDGASTNAVPELRNRIAMTLPGTRVKLKVLREGKVKIFEVKLGQLDQEQLASSEGAARAGKLGFQVQELTGEVARQLGYEGEKGVVTVSVEPGSEAARQLQRGDLIQEVDRKPVDSIESFNRALKENEGKETVLLLVRRGEQTRFVALRLSKE